MNTSSRVPQATLFIRALNWFFRYTGKKVASNPCYVIATVLLFTAICSIKIPLTPTVDDVKTGYTPKNARAFDEIKTVLEFNDGLEPAAILILVLAKDGGSLARVEHLNATVDIIDTIGTHFAVKNYTYYQICNSFCDINEPVRQFRNGFILNQQMRNRSEEIMQLSFPITSFLGSRLDLSSSFFGVTTYGPSEIPKNSPSNIKDLRLIVLTFRNQLPKEWGDDGRAEWERKVGDYYRNEYNNSYIRPLVFSLTFTQDEIVRGGMTLFPFISVGFVIMSIFSIVSVFISAVYMNQWTIHKISFAVNACVCPLLACSTALGLMFWLGLRFGSILCVTPFLVLAIGVDDAFLIINSWQRASAESRSHSRKDRIQDRIAAVLVDVGPSITITSLTNMLGFGIGFIWATPEIQLFCIANSVAIFFDFLYTITLYAAIMSLGGRYEIAMEHSNVDAHVESENRKTKASRFLQAYCEWLSNGFTALLMLILLLIYWWISLRGARSAKANLTAAKLFLKDSPMLEMNDIRNKYVLPAYTYITIFVTNPGNLSNPKRVDRIKSLVAEFENIPECNGPEFTRFWIRDYEKYLESSDLLEQDGETNVYSIENLKEFFSWPEYKHWGGFVKLNNKTGNITFYVTVAYHGEKQADWNEKVNMLHHWRSIADNYSDIGAAVFDDDAVFTDQIETLIPVTIQTSVITLACMTVVCIIFIAHTFTVLIAVSTIISIFLGVFGFLAMWDVNVDPISMATMIISIGLSVDFPAHITYHYYRTGLDSNVGSITERMSHTIVTIGYPLLQCSVSTIVFISCLLFVPSYMSKVFVKTIFLVVVLGLIHAIVVVPAILCALSGIHQFLQGRKDSRSTSSNQTDASKFSHITAISVLRPEDDKENGLTFSAPNR